MDERIVASLIEVRNLDATSADTFEAQLPALLASLPAHGLLEVTLPFDPAGCLPILRERGVGATIAVETGRCWVIELRGSDAPEVMDLRDLEPPLPMQRILEGCARLGPGEALFARTPLYPRMLFPQLKRRSLVWHAIEELDESALVCVARPS